MTAVETIPARALRQERDRICGELRRVSHLRAEAARKIVMTEASLEADRLLYGDLGRRVDAIMNELSELRAAYLQVTGSEMPVHQ